MSIYVELLIRSPLETIWAHTQDPKLHERWDLRFSEIESLSAVHTNTPARFRYLTRIGLGLEIKGYGQTTAHRLLSDGSAVSALEFRSEDRRSLIKEGSGYWKYVPRSNGVRFLTSYDYEPRFGRLGRVLDSLAFRPLMGWATAWSFDRLRIWVETRIEPEIALRHALIHCVARWAIAAVFIYQGVFPKILRRNIAESTMLANLGIPENLAPMVAVGTGVAEVVFGLAVLFFWRSRLPAFIALVVMGLATLSVAFAAPSYLTAAFNPVSLNLAVASLATVDLLTKPEWTPTASRCLRKPPPGNT